MLTIENITAAFGERPLFEGLGFSAGPGSLVQIKGPNGTGKTTLLRIIAGLHRPPSGQICWNEVGIAEYPETYSRLIHYLGTALATKPQLTVRENVTFWARLHGSPEMVDAALSYYRLHPYEDTPCAMLSSGWKKRVALARLLACYAQLWLLDEPDTFLDEEAKNLLVNMVNSRIAQGGIVVFTSHNPLPFSNACHIDIQDFKQNSGGAAV